MGLFKLYNCCAPGLLDYLKSYLKSVSRLHISEFSGYHCSITVFQFFPLRDSWSPWGGKSSFKCFGYTRSRFTSIKYLNGEEKRVSIKYLNGEEKRVSIKYLNGKEKRLSVKYLNGKGKYQVSKW